MGPLTNSLFHFCDLLEKNHISYALIGGIAVTILARERFTKDIDFTISLTQKEAGFLQELFRKNSSYRVDQVNFISTPDIPDMFRVFWREVPVDLLVANTDFQEELINRRQSYHYMGRTIYVATPEDLIVLKLLADRPQDRQDVDAIIKTAASLDRRYIKKWAKIWEIEERLSLINN